MEVLIEGAARLGIDLDSEQVERFQTYYDELTVWNATVNLTAVSGREEVQTRHFLDSLAASIGITGDRSRRQRETAGRGHWSGFPRSAAQDRISSN